MKRRRTPRFPTPFSSRTPGRVIVSACRARSATIRRRASAPPKATARKSPRASTPRRLRSSGRKGSTPIGIFRHASAPRTTYSATARRRVKFNLGRYLAPATNDTIYTANNPSTRIVDTASRSWADTNKNFVVDCDILNPAAQAVPGGDTCGALTGDALNFGKAGGVDAGEPGPVDGLGGAAGRLAVGHQPAAGARPARLAGGRLQPALVGELHRHRQHAGGAGGLSRSGPSSRRTIHGCPAAAATRSMCTR